MLRRVGLVRTDVSKEYVASIIRVTRIGELGTTLAVTSNRRTSEMWVLSRATRRNVPEDAILQLQAGFLLGWFSNWKMEVKCSSEASVHIQATRRYIPEEDTVPRYSAWHS
jgi:hypothetical protein